VALLREIREAARTNAKVLILGETGVGKEVVARLIHRGGRACQQFGAYRNIDLAAFPDMHSRTRRIGQHRDEPAPRNSYSALLLLPHRALPTVKGSIRGQE
jgi:transcriptional regulator of acetoin/glycerol metabolism